jgi:hypothetical protein
MALVEIFETAVEIGDGQGRDIIRTGLDDRRAGLEARQAFELLAVIAVIRPGRADAPRQRDEQDDP